jgi:Cu-Zn family superoxide dismutase
MMIKRALAVSFLTLALAGASRADELKADMKLVTTDGVGDSVGTVTIEESAAGAMFTPALAGLPPGEHGFHVHALGDCGPGANDQGQVVAAGAAKGHWDPATTGRHAGPQGEGHLGDLPAMVVGQDGKASTPVTAPRITDLAQLEGLGLMIHAGGDNYSDQPKPLGGGAERILCGIIE